MLGALSLFVGNVHAGRVLHRNMLQNIIASPMSFFDTIPSGRILNRFGKDIDTIDVVLVQNVRHFITSLLQILTVPIVIGYSTPLILVALVPTSVIYAVVQVSDQTCLSY